MNKNHTLHEILGMKAKNSIFKSVVPTNRKTYEGYKIVEVEPYDDTFLNAITSTSKYDNTIDKILKKVYETIGVCWIIIDTDIYGHAEMLVDEYYMKEVWKLI